MRKTVLTLCFFIFLVYSLSILPNQIHDSPISIISIPNSMYISHSAIDLNNEADLTAFPDKTGSGTENDPYIISNLAITGVVKAIQLDLITSHLVIRDCYISAISGFTIKDCSNIDIINCTVDGQITSYGIWYDTCTNILALNNTINAFYFGFLLDLCNGLLIDNNLIDNTTNVGFQSSSGLTNCNITNNRIFHTSSKGFVIAYPIRIINNTIGFALIGMQILSGSENIIGNTFYNCDIGLDITGDNQIILNNTFHNCTIGLHLIDSQLSEIHYNFFYFNGLSLNNDNSWSNEINYNYFCSNNETIYYVISGIYYDSLYFDHNYYSDYQFQNPNATHSFVDPTIWDYHYGSYNIYGNGGGAGYDITYDRYPLIQTPFNLPTTILVSYANTTGYPMLTFQEGILGYNITWIGIDDYIINGTYWVFQNDIEIMRGVWESNVPITINLDMLIAGDYTYTIRFFDHLSEFQENMVNVDVTPIPIISEEFSYVIIGIIIAGLIGVVIVFYIRTNNCEITDTSWSCRLRNRLDEL